jgi:hypothetical protein
MNKFLWIPGEGVDVLALERLRSHFKRPAEPMGEAWFMGEQRHMFCELLGDISKLSANELQEPLEEIASGTSCFGPRKEWNVWYHYLLGTLLPRGHEAYIEDILEYLITGFIALYPNGVHQAPYKEFQDDVLLTLGLCMMDRHCWNGADIAIGKILHRSNNNPNQVWCWWDSSGDFSASMFFCLKYLPEPLVEGWLRSILAIPSPHWRAQLLVWMVGAHDILNNVIKWPSEFPEGVIPSVSWAWSHCLKSDLAISNEGGELPMASLLPESSRLQALNVFHSYFSEELYLEWLLCISEVPYLEEELAEIPNIFENLYVKPR